MTSQPEPKIGMLMLIDDNLIDQKMYRRLIDRTGLVGTTFTYLYADEALVDLKSGTAPLPDIILLDINMPRMNGFEFLEAATHTFGETFSTVVVMLSTSMNPNDEARARQFKAVREFLHKPLRKEHLFELVDLV